MSAPVLSGPRVVLRPGEEGDAGERRKHGWNTDIERNLGHATATREMSEDEAVQWAEQMREQASDTYWVVEAEGELTGVAFLHSLREQDRKARFAIGMFAPHLTGRGLGTEATRLVLGHAFDTLALHRVDLRVLAFNEGAIACYRKCGFVVEGLERDSCRLDGHWYDDVMMAVLEGEYREKAQTWP